MEGNFLTFDSSTVWATVANLYNAVPVTREHRTTLTGSRNWARVSPSSFFVIIMLSFMFSSVPVLARSVMVKVNIHNLKGISIIKEMEFI